MLSLRINNLIPQFFSFRDLLEGSGPHATFQASSERSTSDTCGCSWCHIFPVCSISTPRWLCSSRGEGHTDILLMERILHQLRLVVFPIVYDGFYTSQVFSRISEPSTVENLQTTHIFEVLLKLMGLVPKIGTAAWPQDRGPRFNLLPPPPDRQGQHDMAEKC